MKYHCQYMLFADDMVPTEEIPEGVNNKLEKWREFLKKITKDQEGQNKI